MMSNVSKTHELIGRVRDPKVCTDDLHRELADALEKSRRGGAELGKIIERQGRDIVKITKSEGLIGDDGDGDWEVVWERAFKMRADIDALAARQPTEDDRALRELAEGGKAAQEKLYEIGTGVGGLAVEFPELSKALDAWDDLSEYGHADTVLALLSRAAVPDAREHLHAKCDCVPNLGPAHCHLCGNAKGSPVPWAECEAVAVLAVATKAVQVELDEMAGRFSEYLCETTGGLLSKTGYEVSVMVNYAQEYYDRQAKEYHDDYCEKSEALEAERDAALAAVANARAFAEGLMSVGAEPYPTNIGKAILAALDGAPESEWEYRWGDRNHHAFLDESTHEIFDSYIDAKVALNRESDRHEDRVFRRHKAGPWLPVEGESE